MTGNKGFKLDQLLRLRAEVEKARTIDLAGARHELDGATAILESDEQQVDRLGRRCSLCGQRGHRDLLLR